MFALMCGWKLSKNWLPLFNKIMTVFVLLLSVCIHVEFTYVNVRRCTRSTSFCFNFTQKWKIKFLSVCNPFYRLTNNIDVNTITVVNMWYHIRRYKYKGAYIHSNSRCSKIQPHSTANFQYSNVFVYHLPFQKWIFHLSDFILSTVL